VDGAADGRAKEAFSWPDEKTAADPFCVSTARPAFGLCPRISVHMSDISVSSNVNIIGDR